MTDPRHAQPRTPLSEVPYVRQVKSYVLRAGRMGPGQARAYEEHGPRFLLNYVPGPFDATAAFGRYEIDLANPAYPKPDFDTLYNLARLSSQVGDHAGAGEAVDIFFGGRALFGVVGSNPDLA